MYATPKRSPVQPENSSIDPARSTSNEPVALNRRDITSDPRDHERDIAPNSRRRDRITARARRRDERIALDLVTA